MTTAIGLFRGTLTAAALVFDLELIGPEEAQRRVLELWQDGCRLWSAPGCWLLVLATPGEFRMDRAPGLPLRAEAGGLAGPGVAGVDGRAVWYGSGRRRELVLSDAVAVSMIDWFDLSGLRQHRLVALDAPPRTMEKLLDRPLVEPNLRALAGLAAADADPVDRASGATDRRTVRWRLFWLGVGVAGIVLLALLAPMLFSGHSHRAGVAPSVPPVSSVAAAPTPSGSFASTLPYKVTTDLPGDPFAFSTQTSSGPHVNYWVVVPAIFIAIRVLFAMPRRRQVAAGAGRSAGGQVQPRRNWLARLVLGSPAKGFVTRRHQRYLRKITRQLETGDFSDGLRNAIAVGGAGGSSMLSLRIPKPRQNLSLTAGGSGGGYVIYGDTVLQHLRQLYLRSADRLEATGDFMSAAFVKANLLADVPAAVALLERHDQYRIAAELAEFHQLDPALVVRLWWLAGDRGRAIDVARSRGAFAAAIERFQLVDPAGATALRAAWVWVLQHAGDRLGAVEAAWPDEQLRPLVRAELAAARTTPGSVGAQLLTFALAGARNPADAEAAQQILASSEPTVTAAFFEGLAARPPADPVQNRRLAGMALRAVLADARIADQLGDRSLQRAVRELRGRADPLLVADLLPIRARSDAGAVELRLPDEPGQLALQHAVTLGDGRILVGYGAMGARLLTPDGRTQARWDVPTDQLVVADHGESALLVSRSRNEQQVWRLDLATGKVRRWTTLRVRQIVDSFDGSMVTVLDEDGIALIDVLSERPRVIRRELDNTMQVLALTRTGTDMTALLSIPTVGRAGERHFGLWRWDVPSMVLRVRRHLMFPDGTGLIQAAVCSGTVIARTSGPMGERLVRYHEYGVGEQLDFPVDSRLFFAAQGRAAIIGHASDSGECHGRIYVAGRTIADYVGPSDIAMTEHNGIVTLFSADGRIAAVSSRPTRLQAKLRTRL
ncbi:MAG: bpX6 domain-containing protein [Actinomycetota bacterium]|nr:bpX6 domain-containing protein [Actinomycetota bacterium]MDQ2955543.1 bpX6 domain-containing protein [Actinomycetota bacterium]